MKNWAYLLEPPKITAAKAIWRKGARASVEPDPDQTATPLAPCPGGEKSHGAASPVALTAATRAPVVCPLKTLSGSPGLSGERPQSLEGLVLPTPRLLTHHGPLTQCSPAPPRPSPAAPSRGLPSAHTSALCCVPGGALSELWNRRLSLHLPLLS